MDSDIEHQPGRFVLKTPDGAECVLEYILHKGNRIEFYHTYVPEKHRGKGLAGRLIRFGLDYAIAHHLRIIPTCSAVGAFIDRNPEYGGYSIT